MVYFVNFVIAILISLCLSPPALADDIVRAGGPGVPPYGEFYIYEDATVFPVNTVNIYHLWHDANSAAGELYGVTFSAGKSATVSAYADYGATQAGTVKATTTAPHVLSSGNIISISGSTNYNGVFLITVVDADEFYFTDTWVANDAAGTVDKGDQLVIGTTGTYRVSWVMSGSSAGANKVFGFEIFQNTTPVEKAACQRFYSATDTGSVSGTSIISCTSGDILSWAIQGGTDGTDMTVKDLNVNLNKF